MPKASPLEKHHRARAAQFGEEDGWIIPLHFGNPDGEYEAVRSRVGALDLCHHNLLRFDGADRVSFLQGMVTNDVMKLASGEGILAAFLDIQGKILADARILCAEDSFLVDLREFRKETIIAHLNRYLIADDVTITDLIGQCWIVSLQGPMARPLLSELATAAEIPSRDLDHRTARIGRAAVRCIRSTHSGEEGYDLIIPAEDLDPLVARLNEVGKRFSLSWIGAQAQETLRVESGMPRYGVDMTEENLFLETGLERAVSFQKGCYLGQEVVERIRSRGHVNKKLVGMVLDGAEPARRKDTIRAGDREIGAVTSSAFSRALKRPVALGYLHRDYNQPGTDIVVDHKGKPVQAVVAKLPFYLAYS